MAPVESVEELDRQLDDLEQKARLNPLMVDLVACNGDTLSIGLGQDVSVLSWVGASGDPPYYASKGNEATQGETIVFSYRDQWSEFPLWSAIPTALARDAMRQFFRTGTLPNNVRWEEV
jgi:hypothetical protein